MIKTYLIIIAVLASSFFGSSYALDARQQAQASANMLAITCLSPLKDYPECDYYIMGAVDGILAMNPNYFCHIGGTSNRQLVNIVKAYMESNIESPASTRIEWVLLALTEEFPCNK